MNIWIYLYCGNGTNTSMNNIRGPFYSNIRIFVLITVQWWANIIKWSQMNIQIYLDATLCTEQTSEYIRMQHIWRINIRIYSYSGNSTNTNTNNIRLSKNLRMNIWIYLYCGNGTNTNTNNIRGPFYSNIRIFEYSCSSLS